ncbi:unnamed protein product [Alopecurus aequalis]
MDFAAMKRRELQALCKRHALAGGGTNADLIARLTATLSGSGGAAEEAVGVVVGKGCLKRPAGGASGGDLDAKKVTFELEEDEEAEVGVTGRGRPRSQVLSSPAAAKTRGRQKAGEAPTASKGNGGQRRRTRSQAGGDSADESDSVEAGADAPVRRPGRNVVNLGAGDGAERVTRKNPAKAEKEEVDVGDAVGRKHQLKRKTRENDIEDVDVSGQVGVSRRSTRSSSHLLEPDALSSPVEKKRGRRKAADAKEKIEEHPTEALHSGRTLRSGVVVVAPVPPIVSESKKSRWKVQEEEPAVEKVAKVEISGRATRSISVAPAVVQEEEPAVKKVAKVEISGRATRSSSVAPAVVQEEEPAVEKVAKVEISGRATRSSSVAPAVVQEEEPAAEKVAKVEISGRATRSSSVAPSVTSPRVIAKKRGRRTDDVHSDEGPDKKMENKRQSSRLTTRGSIHNLNSSGDEASLQQVAAPSKGLPPRQSRRNPSEANMMLNSNTTTESSNRSRAPTEFNGLKIARPTMLNAAKDGVEDGVEKLDQHVGLKKSKLRHVSATVAANGGEIPFSESSGKASATDVQIEVPGPVRRSTRKSVVPSSLELKTDAMHEDIEKKQTLTKPVGRSTRRSVAPDIFEKESKGLTKEVVSEEHVKRPTRKSVVPAMLEKGRKGIITEIIPETLVKKSTRKPALSMVNSENNDHSVVVSSENLQSDKSEELEKQPTVKQPVRRVTRKSVVPATPEKDRKGVPDMLNNENGDRTKMQSDKVGHLEKLVAKEPVRRPTGKSGVPDVTEKEKTCLQEELKSEVSVRTPVCKPGVPNVVNKDSKEHNEFVRREELSVKTRSAHTRLQVALQNDESLRRTTRKSSKLTISPPQSKPTASKGRPAKRRRTSLLQEDMPAEEQKEDQIAEVAHTNDVIEVATSTDLEIGVLPFAAEKSDLQDSQLNSELEGMVVVEPGLGRDEDNSERLEIESEGTVGTTEKPQSNLPIMDCKDVAVSEEAVNSIENDGRCSQNFEQSPTGLQFLPSQGIAERSDTHNAIPCPENSVEQSDAHKAECRVEKVVSSKPDSYQGSDENSVGVEESGGLIFSTQQNNEQEVSSRQKDLVVSAQLDPSEDVDHVVRDVITEDLICKEEEKKDFIPSSDINVPHEISLANEPAENASGVSGAVFCISQCTPVSDEVNSASSRLESPDALDNRIASNTETFQQDNEEEFNVHNGVTQTIHASDISDAAQVEVLKCGDMLLPDVETSAFRDAQLNRKLEGNDFEEQSFSCGKDGSGKINMSPLANKYVMDSRQEQEVKLPHDPSAVKSPKGSITCQDKFVIVSGIGRTSGSMVKGYDIAMDAPGGAKQGDNLSPSANAMLRNRENTPACKIDALELSSDHMSTMDSSAQTVQSISGRLREAGLAVGNPDNKTPMEQVQQDDIQVLEGTLENTALCSTTPESNQQCGLSEEAEPHSLKNERCSSTAEQSPFGLPSPFLQNCLQVQKGTLEKSAIVSATPVCKREYGLPDKAEPFSLKNTICSSSVEDDAHVQEGTLEKAALDSVTRGVKHECELPDAKNGVDESKDIHVGYGVEKPPLPESVSDPYSDVALSGVSKSEDCAYTSDQGLTKSCHEQEQMACQLDMLEAANCMNDFTNPEEVSYVEENKKPVHSTEINSSCENLYASRPVKHESGLGDGLLSSSLIASTDDTAVTDDTDVHPDSNRYQFESTDFLDESKGCSSNEALQQGLKERCDEPKENQVTYGLCSSDVIEADTAKDLRSQVPPLPAEEISNMEHLFLGESSKGSDMHGDLVLPSAENEHDSNTCHDEQQVENMVSSEPDSGKGSDEDLNIVEGIQGRMFSSQLEHEKDEQLIVPLLAAETPAVLDEQAIPELEAGESKKCSFSSEDTSGKNTGHMKNNLFQLHEESHMDPIQGKELPDDLPAPESPEQSTAGQDVSLPDEQPNPELKEGELKEHNLSEDTGGIFDTPYVKTNLYQLHEDSHMDRNQGKELPDDVHAHKSPAQSTIGQDAETSASPDEQPSPELDSSEFEEQNLSHMDPNQGKELPADVPSPKSPAQSTIGQDAETSALPDEQPNPGVDSSEFVERNLSRMDPNQEKELPDDVPAPKSPAQSTIGQDAETSASLDEQPSPELDSSEFEERSLSQMEPNQGKELPDDVPSPKSPAQATVGQDAETSVSPDEQPNPELDSSEFEERNLSHMDPNQGQELPDDVAAPKSPAQSTFGQDPEASSSPDDPPNPELDLSEFEERDLSSEDTSGTPFQLHEDSHMDSNQGKELPDDVPASKSPAQSTVVQDGETSALPDEQPNPELDLSEFEERDLSSEDTSGTPFQFHEDSLIDSNQGKELPDDVPASKSPAQFTIVQDGETSALPDEQPNPELDVSEFEVSLFQFHGDSHMEDPIQGNGLPNDLPAPKSPEESTIRKDAETSAWSDEQLNPALEVGEFGEGNFGSEDTSGVFGTGYGLDSLFELHEDEYNDEHNDDQAAAAMLSSGMTKPTLTEGSGSGMVLLSAAGTPALTDEQLNSTLEGNEEDSFCFDADNSYISATNLSSLPEDTCMETCFEHEFAIGTPAVKSSGESVVFGDNSVPGSAGTCQTSGRRRIDEISKQLLSFKISSAVKGSYIAMDSAKAKQGGNPSRISLLGNTENVPAANPDDPAELNPDWLDVKDSPRQGTNDGL